MEVEFKKPRTKAQIKALLKTKQDELTRVGNLKFDDSETIAKGHVQSLRNEVSDLEDELDQLDAKDEGGWTLSDHYASFGEMCWPRAVEKNTALIHKLKYAPDTLTKSEQLVLASITIAYFDLIHKTNERRNFICNKLKLVETIEAKAAEIVEDMAINPTLQETMGETDAALQS